MEIGKDKSKFLFLIKDGRGEWLNYVPLIDAKLIRMDMFYMMKRRENKILFTQMKSDRLVNKICLDFLLDFNKYSVQMYYPDRNPRFHNLF